SFAVTSQSESNSTLKAVLKDMTRPLFLLSFALMLVFIWQSNGNYGEKIWMGMRPLAIAFVLFYIVRSPWVAVRLLEWSKKSRALEKIYVKSQKAYEIVLRSGKD
ncbi:MAG: hypothetical protein ACXVAX_06050, partial [Pseudobdellovibrio sp.]